MREPDLNYGSLNYKIQQKIKIKNDSLNYTMTFFISYHNKQRAKLKYSSFTI